MNTATQYESVPQPETAQAFVDSLNLAYSAEFVPQSKSRNAGDKKPSLNWRVTIGPVSTDYSQGVEHLPLYNIQPSFWRCIMGGKALRGACETGKYNWYARRRKNDGGQMLDVSFGSKPIPAPKLVDVLYCLVSDSDVLNHDCFESWAGDFGYDPDSRATKKIYKQCRKNALKFRRVIDLDKAREAFQDF